MPWLINKLLFVSCCMALALVGCGVEKEKTTKTEATATNDAEKVSGVTDGEQATDEKFNIKD